MHCAQGVGPRQPRSTPSPYAKRYCRVYETSCASTVVVQEGIYGLMSPDELQKWMGESDNALENCQAYGASDKDELNAVYKQGESVIRDALTGQALDPELVRKARRAELDYFESKNVWFKKPREDAFRKMGKSPITVKWVDVNKGDTENPNYRSRLVAREIRKTWGIRSSLPGHRWSPSAQS